MASRRALYQSVRRVRTDSGRTQRRPTVARSGPGAEDVAGSSNGVDQSLLPGSVDLSTEVADVDIHHVRLWIEAESPDVLGQHRAGLDSSDVAHEELEERVLAHGE